ncbi:MAG: DUF1850 domain-containing protein [Candidatus Fimivivens sp.]|nr:DUF1850 domain-containing protein [Candidatus Fimivivens sp.]
MDIKKYGRGRARAISSACVLLGVIILLLSLPLLPPSLVVSSRGKVRYEKVITSNECEVGFRHSVNKGLIREVYRLDPENKLITLEEGYFQSYGAGMIDTIYETADMNFRQEGDFYILDFKPEWKASIGYIGGNIAGHVFKYGDDTVEIGKLYPKQPFSISISRRSVLKRLLRLT